MNNIVLLGRLTKDADIRSTQSGKVVASFTLAVDRPYTQNGKREVDFIACQIWGKSAEVLGKSVHKGQRGRPSANPSVYGQEWQQAYCCRGCC